MAFLKFIFYIIIFYLIAKIIMRLLAPFMVNKMMDKASKNFEKQFNNPYYKKKPQVKEGETIIEKTGNDSPKKKNNSGEYVDYEEID